MLTPPWWWYKHTYQPLLYDLAVKVVSIIVTDGMAPEWHQYICNQYGVLMVVWPMRLQVICYNDTEYIGCIGFYLPWHCSDVIWASWRLTTPGCPLFVEQLVRVKLKENRECISDRMRNTLLCPDFTIRMDFNHLHPVSGNYFTDSWVRIPALPEEGNLSPFDPKIPCLFQTIEINNNKHT